MRPITKRSKMKRVVDHYLRSPHFSSLSPRTRTLYKEWLEVILETELDNKPLVDYSLSSITSKKCYLLYQVWLEDFSVHKANTLSRMFSVIMTHAISLDAALYNPMAAIKKATHKSESITWTQDQVDRYLSICFKEFKYRSLGLITSMCYEWAQRPVDILNLKWDDVNFDSGVVTITQQKRGTTVFLPLTNALKEMLLSQKETFGFQDYVVPKEKPDGSVYKPFSKEDILWRHRQVISKANLSNSLRLGQLRKTAIVEMVEAGVPTTQIKAVTGHANITSLNPYLKNNVETASEALNKRRKHHEVIPSS